jgi:hypothetical protein
MDKKFLACGLGGGLDVINTSLIYYAAKQQGIPITLGSSRPAPLNRIVNHHPFSDCGTWIHQSSSIDYGGISSPKRYCEPKVSSILEEEVLFFSRKYQGKDAVPQLRQAILQAQKSYGANMFFVDGGGDSLILTKEDAAGTADNFDDPFEGGDSKVLEALSGIDSYLAVIAVGLDVSEQGFQKNIEKLYDKNAYFGRVNLATKEKELYQLNHLIDFEGDFLKQYFDLAENILVLNEEDLNNPEKTTSHTAVIAYHALKGNYGIQRTFVPWEPTTDGQKGTLVKLEHAWMYFFDAGKIHELKLELNSKV